MDSSHNDDRPSDDNNGLPEKEIPWIFGKPEKCDSVEAKQTFRTEKYVAMRDSLSTAKVKSASSWF